MSNLPNYVEEDLLAGFVLTDPDDGHQRCKKISDTVFLYRCEVNGEMHEEEIDVNDIDADEAICGYYDSVEKLIEDNGVKDANMLIAECHFEHNCPKELPQFPY